MYQILYKIFGIETRDLYYPSRPTLFPWARNFTLIAQYWLVPGTD